MRCLIDTNVLIHTLDARNPKKQSAIDTLIELERAGDTVLSSQTLAEYANVALKKFGLPANNIYKHIEGCEMSFTVYVDSPAIVLEAVRGVRDHRFSYDDARIWAAAKLNQVAVILSEDFNVGATVEGVCFVNPFDVNFDPKAF